MLGTRRTKPSTLSTVGKVLICHGPHVSPESFHDNRGLPASRELVSTVATA